jgi:hypothetical protein
MDLLSAAAVPVLWLMRDRFEHETTMALLFWPVVFEMFAAAALVFAGMLDTVRMAAVRNACFVLVTAGYLAAAWLCGANTEMPQIWTIALWLLLARVMPPAGLRAGSEAHRAWLFTGAGYSGLLWGAGFVAMIGLMLLFGSEPVPDANGELTSTSPAWIYPLVWTPYFFAEALVRAWRQPAPSRISAAPVHGTRAGNDADRNR